MWQVQHSIKRGHAQQLLAISHEGRWKQSHQGVHLGASARQCHLPAEVQEGGPWVPRPKLFLGIPTPAASLIPARISKDNFRMKAKESGRNGGGGVGQGTQQETR